MKILSTLEENINLQKLNGACHVSVRNAFFANYCAALLLLKIQDIKGLMLINDRSHVALTKFSPTMSDLNFWGRTMFYSKDHEIKARLGDEESKILAAFSANVSASRVLKFMKIPITAPDHIDWDDVIASLLLIKTVFKLQSSYFNNIVRVLHKWDSCNSSRKQHAINDALMFLMQSDQSSKIVPHLRKLSNLIMLQNIKSNAQKVIGFSKLTEDGEATGTENFGTTNAILSPGENSGNSQQGYDSTQQDMQKTLGGLYKLARMSPNQVTKKGKFTIRNGKLVVKRAKSFKVKKFKAPEFLKPKKQDNGTSEENQNEST